MSRIFTGPLVFGLLAAFTFPVLAQELPPSLVKPGAELKKVATGFKFTEGPVWMPGGFLVFSDIPADTVYKLAADGTATPFVQPSGHSNGLAVNPEGDLVLCMHDRCVSRRDQDGNLSVLAATYDDKPLNSPNDLTFGPQGSFFFTDPPYGVKASDAKQGFNGVYRWSPGKGIELADKSMPAPNGIALSPDNKLLYVADSKENVLQLFDVAENGSISNKRLFADMKVPGTPGASDGLKVANDGTVVATGPGGVWFYAPDGKLLGKLIVPEVTTNVAFGGPGLKTLFITAGKSVYSYEMRLQGKSYLGN